MSPWRANISTYCCAKEQGSSAGGQGLVGGEGVAHREEGPGETAESTHRGRRVALLGKRHDAPLPEQSAQLPVGVGELSLRGLLPGLLRRGRIAALGAGSPRALRGRRTPLGQEHEHPSASAKQPTGECSRCPVAWKKSPLGFSAAPMGEFSTPLGSDALPSGVARIPHWVSKPSHWETPLGRCPPHWETPLGCSRPQRGRDHPDGKLRLGWHHPTRRDEWGGRYPSGHGRARPSYATDLPTL